MAITLAQALEKGAEAHKAGRLQEAERYYRAILKIAPNHPKANHNIGILAVSVGKKEEALSFFEAALRADNNTAQFWLSYITALVNLGRISDAETALNKAQEHGFKSKVFDDLKENIKKSKLRNTENFKSEDDILQLEESAASDLTLSEAIAVAEMKVKDGDFTGAEQVYKRILRHEPKNISAKNGIKRIRESRIQKINNTQEPPTSIIQSVVSLFNKGDFNLVVEQINVLLIKFPQSSTLYNLIGAAYHQLKQLDESAKAYAKAIMIEPNYAQAHYNMGIILKEQGKLDEAIVEYKKATALKPDYVDAYINIGSALERQGKFPEAAAQYYQALSIKEDYRIHFNLGVVLQKQHKLDDAISSYQKALSIKTDYAPALNNIGNTLAQQGKRNEALDSYKRAVAVKHDYAEAYNNMGNLLKEAGQFEDALMAYRRAAAIKPKNSAAHHNMGVVYETIGKFSNAIEAYDRALLNNPDNERIQARRMYALACICDWQGIREHNAVLARLGTSEKYVSPFSLLGFEDAPERHQKRAVLYSRQRYNREPLPFPKPTKVTEKKIRIGYFSSDFHEHPVGYLISRVLQLHDRNKFDVWGYSLHGSKRDALRIKLEESFDFFSDVQHKSEHEIAKLARADGIDIAVDLTGYTTNGRSGIFSYRPAPVQISYLGYPGSMGADFIDYIIADKNLIPPEYAKYYTEKPIYLPNSYIPVDNTSDCSTVQLSRHELGLPNDAIVFCALHNPYKINEHLFDMWARILKATDRGHLWLYARNSLAQENLLKEAKKRGISSGQLIFSKRVNRSQYLAQFKHADLFLDTFPYNAGATAADALWAGLPIVTKIGHSYTARMASSMLHALGIPELIATDDKTYEELILQLANNPQRLAEIKQKIASNRTSHLLFNTEKYVKNLEKGYALALENYQSGHRPRTINVQE